MKRLTITLIALLALVSASSAEAASAPVKVTGLTCGGMENPICVNEVRLGWRLESTGTGVRQTAYEIRITKDGRPVFDSGRVESSEQHDVMPGASLEPGRKYEWRVRAWDGEGKATAWSSTATFGTDINDVWTAEWISTGQGPEAPLPYVRKVIDAPRKPVRRAVIYLCGLGCSQLWLDGEPVEPTRILDPAQTDYDQRALYSAFDVTARLRKGRKSCIGVMLGKGWYSQDEAWTPTGFSYGTPMLRCQLNIEYTDGTIETVGTDTGWKWTEGPVRRTNIYRGEHYDARAEIEGWCLADTGDSAWKPCIIASTQDRAIPSRMLAQDLPPMRQFEEVGPVRMWQAPDGKWVYDFGANRTANVRFRVNLPAGAKLTARSGESLMPDGSVDFRSTGYVHVGYQEDSYTCAGRGLETWSPAFTYHGFQYVELSVEGTDMVPEESWLCAVPTHTDVARRGTFRCSEEQLNALHDIACRTFENAFVGLPVDCNQREKCGWLGDTHAYDRAANINYDMDNFWMKYLEDIRTTASAPLENTLHHKFYNVEFYFADKPAGIPHMIAPGKRLCGVASPDWGTAVVQLPWHLYMYYGNRRILENYYDMMALWTRHIDETAKDNIVYEGLGDWCPPHEHLYANPTKVEFTSTAFHLTDLEIMAKCARILGYSDDAAWFSRREAETRSAMIRKFYNPVKHSFGSQTADAMAMELHLAPEGEEALVADDFVFEVTHAKHGFFTMGIVGLSRFGAGLCRNGHSAEAFEYFTRKGENSWGFMLDSLHVTTLWEEIPYEAGDVERLSGPSHCHPMQGGYDLWFYEDVLGIRPSEDGPGYRVIDFHSTVMDQMDWAEGSLQTAYGEVRSAWRHDNAGHVVWEITVPPCTTARVTLPEGVREVESGSYTFNL